MCRVSRNRISGHFQGILGIERSLHYSNSGDNREAGVSRILEPNAVQHKYNMSHICVISNFLIAY